MNMKPPCGHSSRVLPTLDTGDDFVGLLRNEQTGETVSQGRRCWGGGACPNAPDELFPLVHEEQRNDVEHVGALRRRGGVRITIAVPSFPHNSRHTLSSVWSLPEATWRALAGSSRGRG